MSSPLSMFRKYQGPVLVVLGVILMISFLIVPLVMDYQQSVSRAGGNGGREVVVRWDGGQLSTVDLYNVFNLHRRTIGFVEAVQEEARKQGGEPKVQTPMLRTNDEQIVIMLLLAEKAREMGVTFSDAALRDYLDLVADKTLTHEDFDRVLQETTQGAPLYVSELFSQLRVELLAMYMEQLTDGAVRSWTAPNQTATPAQNWKNYQQLQRRVTLEMLPIAVDDLLAQVTKNPTDEQIQELYDKYKNRFPNPNLPEPGFAKRPEADFAFLKIDFNKFLEEEKQKITEEEIKAEYDRGLERGDYRVPQLPDATPGATPPSEATTPGAETPAATPEDTSTPPETSPATETPDPAGESATEPTTEDPGAGTDEPETTPEDPSENTSENGDAAETLPSDSNDADPQPEGDSSGCGAVVQEEEETDEPASEEAADPAPSTDEGTEPAEAADPISAQGEEPTEEAAAEEPAQPEDPPAEGTQPEASPSEGDQAESPQTPAGDQAAATPQRKNKTLEEVRDDILLKLASPRAQQRREKAEEEALKALSSYSRKYRLWEQLKLEDPTRPKPEAPSAQELAEEFGFESGHTGMVDYLSVEDTPLGNSSISSNNPFMPAQQFRDIGFGLTLYEPLKVTENTDFDISFLTWKVAEVPERIPKLSEVRDQVITAWKRIQARKIAREQAEKLAKQAVEAQGSLAERLPDQGETVFPTNEFTWLRVTNEFLPGFGQLELSSVANVDAVDDQFMEDVFARDENGVGVTRNAGESVYYVFRVARMTPSEDRLREMFLQELSAAGFRRSNLDQLAQTEVTEFKRNTYRHLLEEFDVEWEQPPQQRFQR